MAEKKITPASRAAEAAINAGPPKDMVFGREVGDAYDRDQLADHQVYGLKPGWVGSWAPLDEFEGRPTALMRWRMEMQRHQYVPITGPWATDETSAEYLNWPYDEKEHGPLMTPWVPGHATVEIWAKSPETAADHFFKRLKRAAENPEWRQQRRDSLGRQGSLPDFYRDPEQTEVNEGLLRKAAQQGAT